MPSPLPCTKSADHWSCVCALFPGPGAGLATLSSRAYFLESDLMRLRVSEARTRSSTRRMSYLGSEKQDTSRRSGWP